MNHVREKADAANASGITKAAANCRPAFLQKKKKRHTTDQ
jgi:hypothetical protein